MFQMPEEEPETTAFVNTYWRYAVLAPLVVFVLVPWPATVPLIAAAATRWLLADRETWLRRWVHSLCLPLLLACAVHMVFALFLLVTHGVDAMRPLDLLVQPVVAPFHAVVAPWLTPLSVMALGACVFMAVVECRQPSESWRLSVQLAVGVAAFAMLIPLQAARALAIVETDQDDETARTWNKAEQARGQQRLAIARRQAAETVAADIALLDAAAAERLALTLTTLANQDRFDHPVAQVAFALGVVDGMGGAVSVTSTCLTAECFADMVPRAIAVQERLSIDHTAEGERSERQLADAEEAVARTAVSQAADRLVARLAAPLAALEANRSAETLTRSYVTGLIEIHAARSTLDHVVVPEAPIRAVVKNHPSLAAGGAGAAHPQGLESARVAARTRLDSVDALVTSRKAAERRANNGCGFSTRRWEFRWRCTP